FAQPVLGAGSRAASEVPVEVSINPSGASFVNAGGLTVPGNSYLVAYTGVGQSQVSFYGALPNASAILNPAWLDSNGVPKQLSFGWVGSTGGSTDIHEVSRSVTKSANPVPVLTTTQSYKGTASGSSGSGKFTLTTTVTEAPLAAPITINGTVPSGMRLDTVTGTGWTCTLPTSTTYSCTTTGSSFPSGTTLPPITAAVTVIGPVTETGIGTGTSSRTLSPNALSSYTTTTTVDPTPPVPPNPAVVTIGLNGPVKGKNPNKKVNLKGTTRKKTAKVYVYRASRRHGPATLVAVRTSSKNIWRANSIRLGPKGKAYFCARVGLSFSQTLLVNAQYGSVLLALSKATPSARGDIVYCP
ncbi:MAG: hypothetical protein WCI74_02635, partial [Actinomycetes bacterium]